MTRERISIRYARALSWPAAVAGLIPCRSITDRANCSRSLVPGFPTAVTRSSRRDFEKLGGLVAIGQRRELAVRRSREFRERCAVQPEVDERVFVAPLEPRLGFRRCAERPTPAMQPRALPRSFPQGYGERIGMSGNRRTRLVYEMGIVRPTACAPARAAAADRERSRPREAIYCLPRPAPHHRHQLVVLPRPRAIGGHRAHLLHRRDVNRRSILAPLAPDVGQHAGDLIVAQRRIPPAASDRSDLLCRSSGCAPECPATRARAANRRGLGPLCPVRGRPADDRPGRCSCTPPGPALKRCCSSGVSGAIGAAAPGLPGHSTRFRTSRRTRSQLRRRRRQRRERRRLLAQTRRTRRDGRRPPALAEMRTTRQGRRARPGRSGMAAPGRFGPPRRPPGSPASPRQAMRPRLLASAPSAATSGRFASATAARIF